MEEAEGLLEVPGSLLLLCAVDDEDEPLLSLPAAKPVAVAVAEFLAPFFCVSFAARCESCLARRSALESFGFLTLAPFPLLGLALAKASALAFFSACLLALLALPTSDGVGGVGVVVVVEEGAELEEERVGEAEEEAEEEVEEEAEEVASKDMPVASDAAPRLKEGNSPIPISVAAVILGDQPGMVVALRLRRSAELPRGGDGGALGEASSSSSRSRTSDMVRQENNQDTRGFLTCCCTLCLNLW